MPPRAPITITINGEEHSVESVNLLSLLDELKLSGQRVAVELNKKIVPRGEFEIAELNSGDILEVVQFVGGG